MRTSFGLPSLALFGTWSGALSLAMDAATHVNATIPSKASTNVEPVVIVGCNAHIAGAHYLGWYQECMDKIAGQWGFTSASEVGHFDDGWGLQVPLYIIYARSLESCPTASLGRSHKRRCFLQRCRLHQLGDRPGCYRIEVLV